MTVKILIQRKLLPGKEKEFEEVVRELRGKALHSEGFISGETLRSIEDPSLHLVVSTWKSMDLFNAWLKSDYRKKAQKKIDAILAEPEKRSPFQYE
jgi:heme oxygenase (mycobilin-producing)